MDLAKSEIEKIEQKETNILIFSSMIFITNSLAALYKKYYIYSLFFFLLTLTSLAHHSHYTFYTNIIDKIAVSLVVFYGGYMLHNKYCREDCFSKLLTGVVIMFFLSTLYLYMYGYCIDNYCFHPEISSRKNYHALMHILGSIGHHFIIFL